MLTLNDQVVLKMDTVDTVSGKRYPLQVVKDFMETRNPTEIPGYYKFPKFNLDKLTAPLQEAVFWVKLSRIRGSELLADITIPDTPYARPLINFVEKNGVTNVAKLLRFAPAMLIQQDKDEPVSLVGGVLCFALESLDGRDITA
jgi:hypothetical protein